MDEKEKKGFSFATITQKHCPICNKDYEGFMNNCPKDGSPLIVVRKDPLIGRDIDGRFKIIRHIGKGGMGTVYEAYQESFDRKIAVKILPPALSEDIVNVKRFFREAKSTGRLKHPNTITLFDFGQTNDGLLYIMMEYLDGEALSNILRKEAPFALKRAAHIAEQICDSLYEAHSLGIVHRDLKPDNIFLLNLFGKKDFVKVLDFGIAKIVAGEERSYENLTKAGLTCGTPAYMSPEQAQGLMVDHLSDIYSLGVIFYHMLSGKCPFQGSSAMEVLLKQISEEPPALNKLKLKERIPFEVEKLIMQSLSKDKKSRPQSVLEFKERIKRAVEEEIDKTLQMEKFEIEKMLEEAEKSAIEKVEAIPVDEGFGPTMKVQIPVPSEEKRTDRKKIAILLLLGGIIIISAIYFVFEIFFKEKITPFPVISIEENQSLTFRREDYERLQNKERKGTEKLPIVLLKINSEPDGAIVKMNKKEIGSTPLNLNIFKSKKNLYFTLEKRGYRREYFKIVPDRESEVKILLKKIRSAKREKLLQF